MALEAMIPPHDFAMPVGPLARLRQNLEALEADPDSDSLQSEIALQPPLSFVIKVEVNGTPKNSEEESSEETFDMELNCTLLLRVTLPPLYLCASNDETEEDTVTSGPLWEFLYVMVTDPHLYCSADKPLESLAWLEEAALRDKMNQYAQEELLPYPCVYEVAMTWLSENLFSHLQLQPHLLATTTTAK